MTTGRNDLEFELTAGEVVAALFAHEPEKSAQTRFALHRGDPPAWEVAASHVENFALLDQHVHRLPDLFEGRLAVEVVHLIEVDVIRLESPKARLAGFTDVIGRKAPAVGTVHHRLIELRREDDFVSFSALLEPVAHDFLGNAVAERNVGALRTAVDVRRVDELDAQIVGAVHDLEARGLVGEVPEVHGSQAQAAHDQAGSAQMPILHKSSHG